METLILKDLCVKREVKTYSFYELAKKHTIKSDKNNKTLSLDIDEIVYGI